MLDVSLDVVNARTWIAVSVHRRGGCAIESLRGDLERFISLLGSDGEARSGQGAR